MAEDRTDRLRGGRRGARDRWFGLDEMPDFEAFRHWWHRVGKRGSGRDLASRDEAQAAYREWAESAGRDKGSRS